MFFFLFAAPQAINIIRFALEANELLGETDRDGEKDTHVTSKSLNFVCVFQLEMRHVWQTRFSRAVCCRFYCGLTLTALNNIENAAYGRFLGKISVVNTSGHCLQSIIVRKLKKID